MDPQHETWKDAGINDFVEMDDDNDPGIENLPPKEEGPPNLDGEKVILAGLKGKPELNGREGTIHGTIDMDTERFEVHLHANASDEEPQIVRVKLKNLRKATKHNRPPPSAPKSESKENAYFEWGGMRVELHGLKGKAELNGRVGVVHGSLNKETGRYEVHLDVQKGEMQAHIVKVKGANLQFPTPVSAAGQATWRPTALCARPGNFKVSYDWREVGPGQELPRGLEVMASVDDSAPVLMLTGLRF